MTLDESQRTAAFCSYIDKFDFAECKLGFDDGD